MKYILILLLLVCSTAYGQTTYYIRADSVRFQKSGGNSEFILENATRATTGVLVNYGNGRTRFSKPRIVGDTLFVGVDTVLGVGSGGTPTWQQTLTAGSTLTGTNAVSMGSSTFTMTRINGGWTNIFDIGSKIEGHTQIIGRTNSTDTCYLVVNAEDGEVGGFSIAATADVSSRIFANTSYAAMEARAANGTGGMGLQISKTQASFDGLTNLSTQNRLIGQFGTSSALGYVTIGSGISLSSGTLSASGGGGTPAGNYGNIQLNRNSVFDTPATDTLTYTTVGGLAIKNQVNALLRYRINGTQVVYLPDQSTLTGTVVYGDAVNLTNSGGGTNGQDNTIVGISAGAAATTLSDATIIGYSAGQSLTTPSFVVAIGSRALQTYTTGGTAIIAVGTNALRFATSAEYATFMGDGAGVGVLSTSFDAIYGSHAMNSTRYSARNAGIGHNVFYAADSLFENTALGTDVLYRLAKGATGNVGIGYRTAGYLQGSRNVEIGYQAQALPYNTNDGLNISNGFFGYKLTGVDSTIPPAAEFSLSGLPVTDQKFTVNTGEAGNKGIVIQEAAGQSARTFEILQDGGTSQFAINANGQIARYGGAFSSDGEIFIGRSDLGSWAKATITAGAGISVTNGTSSITIANLFATTGGVKLNIVTGANASIGTSAAMTAGSITINTTAVTASSKIFLTHASVGGTQGILSVGTITAGTSFVINSSSGTDTGTVNWWIVN